MAILKSERESGFSLIELAIAMTVIGLMLAASLDTYRLYYIKKTENATVENIGKVQSAMTGFLMRNGRLPCPADPTLPFNSPNAGKEVCISGTGNSCSGGVCRVNGARDTLADTETILPDKVLVGVVPYVSLGIPMKEAYDGWNSKLSYTVTENLADTAKMVDLPVDQRVFDEDFGAISLRSFSEVSNTDTSILNSRVKDPLDPDKGLANSFPFVVFSHGPDRKGAYNSSGVRQINCTGQGRDIENCDGDSDFIIADYKVLQTGAGFYDDYGMFWDIIIDRDKWEMEISKPMKSKGMVKVGIGTKDPEELLHINGNLRAQAVRAPRYCDEGGGNCFFPELIGGNETGTRNRCGSGVAMGVSQSQLKCGGVVNITSSGITPKICPDGQYMKSINAAGVIQCGP